MKRKLTTILLITSMFFIGCGKNNKYVIISKTFKDDGICGYYYEVEVGTQYTEDSCNKYNVGDTLTFKR